MPSSINNIKNFIYVHGYYRKTYLKAIQIIIKDEWVFDIPKWFNFYGFLLYKIKSTLMHATAPLLVYVSQYFGAENIVKVKGSVLLF